MGGNNFGLAVMVKDKVGWEGKRKSSFSGSSILLFITSLQPVDRLVWYLYCENSRERKGM